MQMIFQKENIVKTQSRQAYLAIFHALAKIMHGKCCMPEKLDCYYRQEMLAFMSASMAWTFPRAASEQG